MLQYLLQKQANLNDWAETFAKNNNDAQQETFKALRDHNPTIDKREWDICTPLQEAVRLGHTEIIRLPIEANADVNDYGVSDESPLHYAARNDNEDVVIMLLEHGARTEAVNDRHETALHTTAIFRQINIAKHLTANRADVNAEDWRGWRPLDIVRRPGSADDFVALLELLTLSKVDDLMEDDSYSLELLPHPTSLTANYRYGPIAMSRTEVHQEDLAKSTRTIRM
jgi:ankyrin repeat protein